MPANGCLKLLRTAATAVLLPLVFSGCGAGESSGEPLTFVVRRQALISSVSAEGTVEALRSHALITPRLRGTWQIGIAYLAPEGSFLQKGDVAVEFDGEQFRTRLDQALRNLESARSDLAKLDAEQESKIAQLQAQIMRAEASMESSRLKLAELEFIAPREREIRQMQIDKSAIEAANARRKLDSSHQVHREERSQHLLRIKQEESKVQTEQTNLEQLVIKAPVDGYMQYGENPMTDEKVKPGDNAYAGRPVALIPDVSSLQVKLQLSETEVQNMVTGQTAEILFESLAGLKLPGKITQVAQVAKPVRRNSEVKTVEVTVSVEGKAEGLVPGITATCTIVKQEVQDAVVVPLESIFEKDSAKVVYALDGEDFTTRQIELGARGDNFAVVLSGLEGGEKLALREPDQSRMAR